MGSFSPTNRGAWLEIPPLGARKRMAASQSEPSVRRSRNLRSTRSLRATGRFSGSPFDGGRAAGSWTSGSVPGRDAFRSNFRQCPTMGEEGGSEADLTELGLAYRASAGRLSGPTGSLLLTTGSTSDLSSGSRFLRSFRGAPPVILAGCPSRSQRDREKSISSGRGRVTRA